jgi:hypothetical protein
LLVLIVYSSALSSANSHRQRIRAEFWGCSKSHSRLTFEKTRLIKIAAVSAFRENKGIVLIFRGMLWLCFGKRPTLAQQSEWITMKKNDKSQFKVEKLIYYYYFIFIAQDSTTNIIGDFCPIQNRISFTWHAEMHSLRFLRFPLPAKQHLSMICTDIGMTTRFSWQQYNICWRWKCGSNESSTRFPFDQKQNPSMMTRDPDATIKCTFSDLQDVRIWENNLCQKVRFLCQWG